MILIIFGKRLTYISSLIFCMLQMLYGSVRLCRMVDVLTQQTLNNSMLLIDTTFAAKIKCHSKTLDRFKERK